MDCDDDDDDDDDEDDDDDDNDDDDDDDDGNLWIIHFPICQDLAIHLPAAHENLKRQFHRRSAWI